MQEAKRKLREHLSKQWWWHIYVYGLFFNKKIIDGWLCELVGLSRDELCGLSLEEKAQRGCGEAST